MIRQYLESGKVVLTGNLPEILEKIYRLAVSSRRAVEFNHVGRKTSNTKVIIDVADKNKQ